MKRILIAACALALLMAGCTPALAAEAPSPSQEPVKSCYYPIAVDSYTSGPFDELRISKTYQELLCKGWSHHLIHMTAVHLWQNGILQLKERE